MLTLNQGLWVLNLNSATSLSFPLCFRVKCRLLANVLWVLNSNSAASCLALSVHDLNAGS